MGGGRWGVTRRDGAGRLRGGGEGNNPYLNLASGVAAASRVRLIARRGHVSGAASRVSRLQHCRHTTGAPHRLSPAPTTHYNPLLSPPTGAENSPITLMNSKVEHGAERVGHTTGRRRGAARLNEMWRTRRTRREVTVPMFGRLLEDAAAAGLSYRSR